VQATLKKAANAAAPQYRLNNTGSEEKNVSLTLARRTEHLSSELFYSYFRTKLGIFTGAHIGNLTDLAKAIEADPPRPGFYRTEHVQDGTPVPGCYASFAEVAVCFTGRQP
jgi:hypothetical protein